MKLMGKINQIYVRHILFFQFFIVSLALALRLSLSRARSACIGVYASTHSDLSRCIILLRDKAPLWKASKKWKQTNNKSN